jgi:rSAM/selenodomain-associated transferase 2
VSPSLSVIIPARNEAQALPLLLDDLAALRAAGAELLLVDGGSQDATCALADGRVDQVLHSPAGRAQQMNLGAAAARGDYLWFVHADTRLSEPAINALLQALQQRPAWGYFDVRLSGPGLLLGLIGRMISWRSGLTGVASGDQGIFVSRDIFQAQNGYAQIPLMEDIELSRRLKRLSRPRCLHPAILTCSRRWQQHGVWRTVLLMWCLRLAYYCGVSPEKLARRYK